MGQASGKAADYNIGALSVAWTPAFILHKARTTTRVTNLKGVTGLI